MLLDPLLALAMLLQDAPPPLPSPPDAAPIAAPALDIDGEVAQAGRLPKSTATDARAAWDRLVAASLTTDPARQPVTGFDLSIDLRLKIAENRTNDFHDARYAWLSPGWLLADTGKGRRHLRGAQGDWLIDDKAEPGQGRVRLDVGRENAEDRRQIEEALDVARLFVGLVDPRAVRVQKLAAHAVPEALVPPARRELAQRLSWFELRTPDLHPGADNRAGARVLLGLAPDSGLARLAIADDVRAPERLNPTTSCVDLDDWRPLDGYAVPRKILVFLRQVLEAQGAGGATSRVATDWRAEPALDLVVKRGSLRPSLKREDFLPPPEAPR